MEYYSFSLQAGLTRDEALASAGVARLRPILMTTVAMIAGMLPIALGIGAGAEARSPMAVAVVGGLCSSTALTLVIVPVVFTYTDDFSIWLRGFASRLLRERAIVESKQPLEVSNVQTTSLSCEIDLSKRDTADAAQNPTDRV